ncbi:Acetylesterase [Cladobotryum mycophilum]|uniref:Acetylesterase n=1 Tax=Cladobotryum mycophilum TaxID=491253 RepID=A0ABR0T205_9HYPO
MLPFLLYASAVAAASIPTLPNMKNLVLFGDSYTDEGRLGYIFGHNALPPPGQLLPATSDTSVGDYTWGRVAATKAGAMLYNYAVGAAMVTNNVTSHYMSNINGPFPSISEYEIPAFKADLGYKGLYPDRKPENTVYGYWIGTNDLGIDGFLGDKQVKGTTISSFVEAIFKDFDELYKLGGRQFVLLNTGPLDVSPMYAAIENGGTGDNSYWGNKKNFNTTELQVKIQQYTTSANTMFETGVPYYLLTKRRWPGATFSVFDVHSLLLDLRADPQKWFTAPYNVTWSWKGCGDNGCYQSNDPKTSYMWYDEVHISGRTSEIVGTEFLEVVKGKSKYGSYYRS